MKSYIALGAVLDLVLIDQIIKYFVAKNQPSTEIFSWLSIIYAENYGIAFSLPITGWITILLTLGVLIIMGKWWHKTKWHIPFILLFSGAIGNLIDRIFRGFVVDYISVGNFPILNLADICITLGVLLLLFYEYNKEKA